MNDNPVLSVLVPTITFDAFLAEAVNSVLSTCDDVPVEVLVLGDGPSGSADTYEWSRDPRVRLDITNDRLGTPRTLNRGIALARGEFIGRLDADDISLSDRFSSQVNYLRAHPDVAVVGGWACVVDGSGRNIGTIRPPTATKDVLALLPKRNCLVHSSIVVRKSAIQIVGGYNVDCPRMQDYELFLRLGAVYGIANVPREVVKYRVHRENHAQISHHKGSHIRAVTSARRKYCRARGISAPVRLADDLVWRISQALRVWGLRPPSYLKPDLISAYRADSDRLPGLEGTFGAARAINALRHPGFRALGLWRLAKALRCYRVPVLPQILRQRILRSFGCDFSLDAQIAAGARLPHPVGIVIGADVRVGPSCTIMQNVTLGGNSGREVDGRTMPEIGEGVFIGPGAVVVGPVKVGDCARIGANAVVTENVFAGESAR